MCVDPDRCPRCDQVGAVIEQSQQLGRIYECFHCTEELEWKGRVHLRQLTWAVVNGMKTEVIG